MKKNRFIKLSIAAAIASLTFSANAESSSTSNHKAYNDDNARSYTYHRPVRIAGTVVTGPNTFCGEDIWTFEDQGIAPLTVPQMGAYAEGSELPDELTPASCAQNPILATRHADAFSFDPPGPAPALLERPDKRLENIPLRDVPKVGGALEGGLSGVRVMVKPPSDVPANPFPAYAGLGQKPITLFDWASARGNMIYRCHNDGTSTLRAQFRNLIPNGVYSMWGIWKSTIPNGPTVDLPAALGGVPNVLVPDQWGRASFKRHLPFCPSEATKDGSLLLWATLAFHSDGSVYAGVPETGAGVETFVQPDGTTFESTLGLMMHHEQLAFPINFTSTIGK